MLISEVINRFGTQEKFIDEVETRLAKLIAENSDFVYNASGKIGSCSYNGPCKIFDTATLQHISYGPECDGCIFGQILKSMGWDDQSELMTRLSINHLLKDIRDKNTLNRWKRIQSKQDLGASWGEAYQQ